MSRHPEPVPRWQQSIPIWLSGLFQVASVVCLLGYVMVPQWPRAYEVISTPFALLGLPVGRSGFTLALYVLLALAAVRRKRLVVWATVWLFEVPSILGLITALLAEWYLVPTLHVSPEMIERILPQPTDLLGAVVAGLVITVLLLSRRAFPARVERGAWRRALATLVGGWLLSFSVALLGSIFVPGTLHGWRGRLRWSFAAAVGDIPEELRGGFGPAWLAALCSVLSVVAVLAAILVFIRSARSARAMSRHDELRIRALLATTPDGDSLGYFGTRREKAVVFSPDGEAAIAYRVLGGVCMASGDPIGQRDAWPSAIKTFIAHAREFGWTVGALAASADAAEIYRSAGLRVFHLGDEAIVDTAEFDLRSRELREVHAEFRRVERMGYTVSVRRQRDVPDAELDALSVLINRWRHGERERGFSMALGRFGDRSDDSMVIVTASDAEGQTRGVLTFVPWARCGLSLDLMRRSPEAASGTTAFLICSLLRAAPDMGIEKVSLNFAMLRHIFDQGDQLGAGPIDRLLLRIVRLASRKWQLESLYRYNERYQPRWAPRLLCYDRASNLGYIALTAARLEGFLPAAGARIGRGTRPAADPRSSGHPSAGGFAAQVREQDRQLWLRTVRGAVGPAHSPGRLEALAALREAGMNPYPVQVPRDASVREVVARHGELGRDARTADICTVVARVLTVRDHGGVVFATVREQTSQIQVLASRDATENFALWRRTVQPGDIVSVTGEVITTHSGELSIEVGQWTMAAKCLRPPPSKRFGVQGAEAAVRERHIALAYSTQATEVLVSRARIVAALRGELGERRFLEVSTPMLQLIHGGANARPFKTYSEAYGLGLTMRIAPELALKKLCIGGFERIFELGRNFRNEGADATHNPEFTSLEAYQAFADYRTMEELARTLIQRAAIAAHGSCHARLPDGTMLDISGRWPVVDVFDAVSRAVGAPVSVGMGAAELRQLAHEAGVQVEPTADPGQIVGDLYDKLVEPATVEPTFYARFPLSTSPLTKADRDDPRLVERWDLVACGMELGTAYSELNDPVDQRHRFVEQSLLAARGNPEAMEVDESFLRALEFGMPPTGGLGLGVDRIVMFLLGLPIRQTLAFPFVRPSARQRGN